MSRFSPYSDSTISDNMLRKRQSMKNWAKKKITIIRETDATRMFGYNKKKMLDRKKFTNTRRDPRPKNNTKGANIRKLLEDYARKDYTPEEISKVMPLSLDQIYWYDNEYKIFTKKQKLKWQKQKRKK